MGGGGVHGLELSFRSRPIKRVSGLGTRTYQDCIGTTKPAKSATRALTYQTLNPKP